MRSAVETPGPSSTRALGVTRRALTELLVRDGRREECLALWQTDDEPSQEDGAWLAELTSVAMHSRKLWLAGEYAYLLAALRWGSNCYPRGNASATRALPLLPTEVFLTISKLRHDIDQYRYLQHSGVFGHELTPVIAAYQSVIDRLVANGADERIPLDEEAERSIGRVFNRIVHVRNTPRVSRAVSNTWDAVAVERQYLETPPGVVVIDDFLSSEALEELRLFCLESTVWSGNRYAHGRLGAFFHDGFNCPLLLQIAEELRDNLPRVIGDRYPLRQLWGFKNEPFLPGGTTTHADFAAVNVNFWITPTEANLDPSTGGLVVYGVDAPLDWNFDMYNCRPDLIQPFLEQRQAKSVTIPYRANRAIIFNSDLFHATAEVRFRPEYENRRVNITMLYGERDEDVHHREVSRGDLPPTAGNTRAPWRSSAFSRTRGWRR
jgi:hypothetical protein